MENNFAATVNISFPLAGWRRIRAGFSIVPSRVPRGTIRIVVASISRPRGSFLESLLRSGVHLSRVSRRTKMLPVLPQQKLIGHARNVIAHDQVPGFRPGEFFV